MDDRLSFELLGFLLGACVTEKIAAADFRPGQVLQQVGLSHGGMKFYVKVETAMAGRAGGSLVQSHHVGKRNIPKVVELDQNLLKYLREIA